MREHEHDIPLDHIRLLVFLPYSLFAIFLFRALLLLLHLLRFARGYRASFPYLQSQQHRLIPTKSNRGDLETDETWIEH